MNLTTPELSLLVIAGLTAGMYAKSEGASSVLAAVVGIATSVIIYLITH